ncbi:MAG TPA: zinc ribbon domain-containing protein, partial [Thermoplasmata archaeon]|nr:zinc ribbon domain-containing protein [Thermoplasmata archaeon]
MGKIAVLEGGKFACSKCGAKAAPNSTRCSACGEPLAGRFEAMKCGTCGSLEPRNAKLCSVCTIELYDGGSGGGGASDENEPSELAGQTTVLPGEALDALRESKDREIRTLKEHAQQREKALTAELETTRGHVEKLKIAVKDARDAGPRAAEAAAAEA